MPKRSTHTYASEENDDVGQLTVYYCLYCGQNALIIDAALESLPTRKTDRSAVIEDKAHMYRLLLEKGEHKLIKRSGGFERQFRLNCSKCDLPIAYQCEREQPRCVFLLDGSLSAQPKVSFDHGESEVPKCIQSTGTGEVKLKLYAKVEGPRCVIQEITDDHVKILVKDAPGGEKKQNELMIMFLQKAIGLESKSQINIDMGKSMKNKVLVIKEIPAVTVYRRLKEAMNARQEIGPVSKSQTPGLRAMTGAWFEKMPDFRAEKK